MNLQKEEKVLVIGAGLAGSEAALLLAEHNIQVVLAECKDENPNPAQKMKTFGELVCTNSLKSKKIDSTHGLLKREMEALNSIIVEAANKTQVPAGDALAVDRESFSKYITEKLEAHKNIEVVRVEIGNPVQAAKDYNCKEVVIASGPLTTKPLEDWIINNISSDDFYFYDAIAPIVDADSLDYSKLYFKDRYKNSDENKGDYLNAPMNKEEYEQFIFELNNSKKVDPRSFEEKKFFEGCLPVDIMAQRGIDTLRFSCMKPVGLEKDGHDRPYAVVQLRKENLPGSAYNLVGFQNRLTYSEQKRVFRMIPGLENANFIHLGSIHRNSFINARKLLNFDLSLKTNPDLYFAGQISGVEGYTESASMGQYVALQIVRKRKGLNSLRWPAETAIGALVNYIMSVPNPTPSNINFGLFPEVDMSHMRVRGRDKKRVKKKLIVDRAHKVFDYFRKDL